MLANNVSTDRGFSTPGLNPARDNLKDFIHDCLEEASETKDILTLNNSDAQLLFVYGSEKMGQKQNNIMKEYGSQFLFDGFTTDDNFNLFVLNKKWPIAFHSQFAIPDVPYRIRGHVFVVDPQLLVDMDYWNTSTMQRGILSITTDKPTHGLHMTENKNNRLISVNAHIYTGKWHEYKDDYKEGKLKPSNLFRREDETFYYQAWTQANERELERQAQAASAALTQSQEAANKSRVG